MPDLDRAISEVRERIARFRGRQLNEQDTKATLIEPVLRALGWNLEDLDEVRREYKNRRSDKPVDYSLMLMRSPKLFVEAKALDQDLTDRRWLSQIMGYAGVAGVEWIALSNGDEYRLYNAHAAVAVDEKLFRAFKVSDADGRAEDTLRLLARERMTENRLDVLWRAEVVDRQVRAALEELFDPERTGPLERLLQKRTTGVSPADMRASLRRAQIVVTFPSAADEPAPNRRAPPAPARKPAIRGTKVKADPPLRLAKGPRRRPLSTGVTLQDLIAANVLRPPVELETTYRGVKVRARIESDASILVNGQRTNSPSTAANIVRETVLKAQGRSGTVNTNGWVFWSFTDQSGASRPLAAVRDEIKRRRGKAGEAETA